MEDRKIFMGGMGWETTDHQIRDYFSQFGQVESVNMKVDQMSGRSRGFGFLVFKESSSVDQVLDGREHIVNHKKIDVKRAKARPGKVFVGGVPSDMDEGDIRQYFGQFGTVSEIERPYDKFKGRHKNFCFITFEREDVLRAILKNPRQRLSYQSKNEGDGQFKDVEVDVKKVIVKPKDPFNQGMGGPGGGPMDYNQQGWGGYDPNYYGGQGYDGYGYGGGAGGGGGYGGYGGGNNYYGGGGAGGWQG